MTEPRPDPVAMLDDYADAAVKDRRALAGLSRRGWELALATGVAVVFLAWAVWAVVLV